MPEGTNEAGSTGEGQKEGAGSNPAPDPKANAGAAGEGGSKTPEAPKGEKKPEAKADGGEPKTPAPKQIGEDDEIPDDTDLISMSKPALAKRLERHTKKELRERFGTDNLEQIKADLAELKTLREEKEQKRRAELSENERLKEDLAREKKAREEAEKKAQQTIDAQTFAEYDRDASTAIGELVAPKHVKRALRELKEHVLTLDDAELKNPKKVFASWVKEFVKENPEFAKPVEEPKKIALTTGSNPNAKKEKADPQLAHKTAKPGQVNSMSRAEYLKYKQERGLS